MLSKSSLPRYLLLGSVAFGAITANANAQTSTALTTGTSNAPSDAETVVVVTGYAKQLESATSVKRNAGAVIDSVTSDDVGSLPDFGLGEALIRVPGVTTIINNGRGEAQLFTLRGLNADYNAVQIDGFSLPATETTRRNVSLDVIPSSLAKRVDVYKTISANQTANAIGGIANLVTRSAFDHKGLFVAGRVDLTDWTNKREIRKQTPSGQAEFIVSDRLGANKDWGVVIDASYFRRDSNSWDSATDTYSYVDPSTGKNIAKTSDAVATAYAVPDRQRWLYYDNLRQRGGLFAKLEYQKDDFKAYVTASSFIHQNDEDRQSNILIGGSTTVGAIGTTNVTATSGTVAKASAQADLAHYLQNRQISYIQTGFDWDLNAKSHLSAAVNYGLSTYRQNAALYTYKAASATNLGYSYTYSAGSFPIFTPVNASALYNPAVYLQSEKTNNVDKNAEHVLSLRSDFSYNSGAHDQGLGYNAGVEGRFMQRQYDYRTFSYTPNVPANFTLAGALSPTQIYPYNAAGRYIMIIDEDKAESVFAANASVFTLSAATAANNITKDYHLNENIAAGYVMGRYVRDALSSTFGLRYEDTSLATGSYTATKSGATTTYNWDVISHKYGKLLPSANLSYDLTPELKLRAAASQALGRPNYNQLAANSSVTIGAGTQDISMGNPELKPRESTNLDLSLEYYPGRRVLMSAAVFHKDIKNEILTVSQTETQTIAGSQVVVTTKQPINASKSGVDGVELNFVYSRFDFLPGAWSGLGVSINGTFLSEHPNQLTMSDGSIRKLPAMVEAAKETINASLHYNYGPFGAKLAYNHTSQILWTVAIDSPVNDLYYAPQDVYDLQATYDVNEHLTLIAQGKNLTNSRPSRMFGLSQELLREELDNGKSYWLGFKFKY